MTDEKETPAEPEEKETPEHDDHEGSTESRLTGLENAIGQLKAMVMGKGNVQVRSPSTRSGDPDAVAAQVKDEVEKLRQAEDAKRRSTSNAARLKEIEDKVERLTEKAPAELRAVTRYLWGDPDEEK